ncbi:toxin-antitoxin system YwqK family antitoxin [Brumimicrobium aurantiacum]|uniref:Toxin-antitoxin system YwqK family antitoxin n=1 Tax=Brumimicrobium aurantiacum TaxID=1737063 RepID=A0A3E1F066_9FLAO|nr:hypothetical protein [Brumimicrobium aurantiacum]RFC55219.1 hypothetical protein DXU93_05200 [Brumimicrobium aurantiacum]
MKLQHIPLLFLQIFLINSSLNAQPEELPIFRQYHATDTLENQNFIGHLFDTKDLIIRDQEKDTIEIVSLRKGKKHGERKIFYKSGQAKAIAEYKNGFLDGAVKYYQQYNQLLTKIEHYKSFPKQDTSLLDGKTTIYRNGTEIQEEYEYAEGLKNGKYRIFNYNGTLKEEGQLENGINVGRRLSYDGNGRLRKDENYKIIDNPNYIQIKQRHQEKYGEVRHKEIVHIPQKKAVLDGTCRYYYKDFLKTENEFLEGQKHGTCKEYHQNSTTLSSVNEYKNNLRHGAFVNYFANGKVKSKGIYYRTIKVDDQVYNNVYDGEIIHYKERKMPDGSMQITKDRVEHWDNYMKNGVFENYSYHNGTLTQRTIYKDNLKAGLEQRFDQEGNKSYEANYEIVTVNGKQISQKTGTEKAWNNGNLSYVKHWKSGKEHGITTTYYANGNIERKMTFVDNELKGPYQSYYENGQLKEDLNYQKAPYSSSNMHVAWNRKYDENGKLTNIFYAQGKDEKSINLAFENGQPTEILLANSLRFMINKNKKLKSVHWINYSRPYLGFDNFSNGQLRRVHFNANGFNPALANFTTEGKIIQVYTNTGQNVRNQELENIAQAIAESQNPDWNNENLVTEGFTNKTHQWKFADGTPFFKVSFKDSLPDGIWTVYSPITKDTIYRQEYSNGKPIGNWFEKTIDGINLNRSSYHENHKIKKNIRYIKDGIVKEIKETDKNGNEIYYAEYFEDGTIHNWRKPKEEAYLYMRKEGDTSNYRYFDTRADSIQIERQFYAGNQLKTIRKNNITTGRGEVRTYYENGQLNTLHEMKDKVAHGVYKRFRANGELWTIGSFKEKKRDGKWINYDENGKAEISNFKNGKIVIEENLGEDDFCRCYDTSLQTGSIGYAGMLSHFEEYENVVKYFPKKIVPIDSLNYDHIFYLGLQTDNNRSGGYTSFKLLMFRDFSFHYPAQNYLKFNLNPCRTTGYISNMRGEFSYQFNNERTMNSTLYAKNIAIGLNNNPLMQSNGNAYTVNFDTKRIRFNENDIQSITFNEAETVCYPPGIINSILQIEIKKAALNYNRPSLNTYGLPLFPNEAKQFYGFEITVADLEFQMENLQKTKIHASAERIVAGANYVAGKIKVEGNLKEENVFILKSSNTPVKIDEIQRFLEQKGFYRVKIEQENDALYIEFFTEK